jgi:hypothetical protein
MNEIFAISPRSGRQNKAWGASPRIATHKVFPAHEMGDSAAARFAGSMTLSI